MQADKNKIADLFNNQKQALPDDFWSSIEDQIPIYEEKKRKPFFLLPSCLAVSICALLVVSIFAYIYFNNKSGKNQNASLNTATHIKGITKTRPEIIHSKSTKYATTVTNQIGSQSIMPKGINKLQPSIQNPKIYNHSSNQTIEKNRLDKRANLESNNVRINSDKTYSINEKQQNSKSADNQEVVENSLSSELNPTAESSSRSIAKSSVQQQSLTLNEKPDSISAMALLNAKYFVLQYQSIYQPIEIKYIKMNPKSNAYHIEVGYRAGLFTASMTSKSEGPSNYITQRQETESDFISHEFNASLNKSLSKKFNTYAGLRYTNIQTLFDYSSDVEEVSLLVYKKGKRTIQSTQALNMIDVNLGIEYVQKLNRKFKIYPSAGIAYNLSMKTKGKFLNDKLLVASINDSEFYKKSAGFNLESSLKLGYKINPKLQSFLSVSYRHYLSSFSHTVSPIDINYNGIMFGLGLKHSLF
jgi:hypothetical protein